MYTSFPPYGPSYIYIFLIQDVCGDAPFRYQTYSVKDPDLGMVWQYRQTMQYSPRGDRTTTQTHFARVRNLLRHAFFRLFITMYRCHIIYIYIYPTPYLCFQVCKELTENEDETFLKAVNVAQNMDAAKSNIKGMVCAKQK